MITSVNELVHLQNSYYYIQGRSHKFLGGQVELLQSKADLMNTHA